MPLTEAKPDALATTYATSLFDLAMGKGGQAHAESILGQLEDILELARSDARFGEFIASRVVATDRRAASLDRIFKGRADDLVVRFLQILNEKDRLGQLPAIVAAYDAVCQHRFGRVEVDVFTAEPLAPDAIAALRSRLGQTLGRDVVLHPYVDAGMIGGVKFRLGDQLVDASIATSLRRLREQLQSDGAGKLRARFGKILGS
ncbi:MAG: ATP synthase F1 subunit delta [Phycisphaerae bacterium]|nr:ATP synthase F1 subunit delta [Phycisphaerae bacterium]